MSDKEINFRCTLSPLQSAIRIGNDTIRISIDVPRSDIGNAIALAALTDCVLDVSIKVNTDPLNIKIKPAKERKPQKESKPKGNHGAYWEILVGHNAIFNHPDLLGTLAEFNPQATPEQVLRDLFGVTSRSFISPAEFEAWLKDRGLENIITISRQALAKL